MRRMGITLPRRAPEGKTLLFCSKYSRLRRGISRSVLVFGTAALLSAGGLSGCTAESETTLTVLAASSLSSIFDSSNTELSDEFFATGSYPENRLQFSFDGSQNLVSALAAGQPGDVLLTANASTMEQAQEQGLVGDSTCFATNELVLIVPADNPEKITGIDDSLQGTDLVLCAPEVPCGQATAELLEYNNFEASPVSEEQKVTDVVGKVETGQADAGIVYATDAQAAADTVIVFPIPNSKLFPNQYLAAPVIDGSSTGSAFVSWLLEEDVQQALTAAGFKTEGC